MIEVNTEMNNSSFINDTLFDCEELIINIAFPNWYQIIGYLLYTSIFIISLIGNALVCYVVYRIPRMKTVTNFFIANLAVGDMLMNLFCVPTTFISTIILQAWPFGAELCPSVNYAQVTKLKTLFLIVLSFSK